MLTSMFAEWNVDALFMWRDNADQIRNVPRPSVPAHQASTHYSMRNPPRCKLSLSDNISAHLSVKAHFPDMISRSQPNSGPPFCERTEMIDSVKLARRSAHVHMDTPLDVPLLLFVGVLRRRRLDGPSHVAIAR
jgi:hypothetical protein